MKVLVAPDLCCGAQRCASARPKRWTRRVITASVVSSLSTMSREKLTVGCTLATGSPSLMWNVVRSESLNKPELAAAFQTMTDIGIRGSRFVMENPDEAAAILHERLPDLELGFLKGVVRDLNAENLWGVDGAPGTPLAEHKKNVAERDFRG